MIYSFFKTNKLWITAMRWSLGHRHIHTLIPWQYNVINQPGGLWAGLSGTDDVLSNDHQIREDYIHTLVICLRNTDPLSACVCETEERERNSLCVSVRVRHSVVSLRDICLHACLRHYGRQTMSSYTQRRAPSVRPYQSYAIPAMHCNTSIMHLPEKDNLIQQE